MLYFHVYCLVSTYLFSINCSLWRHVSAVHDATFFGLCSVFELVFMCLVMLSMCMRRVELLVFSVACGALSTRGGPITADTRSCGGSLDHDPAPLTEESRAFNPTLIKWRYVVCTRLRAALY